MATSTLELRPNEDRIMYQNQSHLAQKYFEMCGICPDLEDLVRITDLLVVCAKHKTNDTIKESLNKAQQHINDKYKK
jgi:hypothetical protein